MFLVSDLRECSGLPYSAGPKYATMLVASAFAPNMAKVIAYKPSQKVFRFILNSAGPEH